MSTHETLPTVQSALDLGLTTAEFERIQEVMGRIPNHIELYIFSIMWSEELSYKNSIIWLQTLPNVDEYLHGDGDEKSSSLMDIGHDLACFFRIKSHRLLLDSQTDLEVAQWDRGIHPEMYAKGARPILMLHSLFLGSTKPQKLIQRIRDNSKRLGVPVMCEKVIFNTCYNSHPFLNTMMVGILEKEEIVSRIENAPGNPIFVVGPANAKEKEDHRMPPEPTGTKPHSVDINDLPLEKRLLEASLAARKAKAVVQVQHMANAGIVGAAVGICAKSEFGTYINLDKLSISSGKDTSEIDAWEILRSQGKEQLLLIGQKGKEDHLSEVFKSWNLACVQIGEVKENGRLTFYLQGEKVVDLPVYPLLPGGGAPVYESPFSKPKRLKTHSTKKLKNISNPKNYVEIAKKIFQSPNIRSKHWITTQKASSYPDQPTDAALLTIENRQTILALSLHADPVYVEADPYLGTMITFAEAARGITCSGGEPTAVSSCLNFGDPYDPEAYWRFVHAVKGMSEACRKLGIPVTDSEVNFYKQLKDDTEPICPTPTIGMLGIVQDIEQITSLNFKEEGHQIYMLGTPKDDISSSEYLRLVHGIEYSPTPSFDMDEECHIQKNLKILIKNKVIQSAHSISEGGLFTALMECAITNELGFDIESDSNFRKDAYLFGQSQNRIVVTIAEEVEDSFVNFLNANNVPFSKLGEVTGRNALIDKEDFGRIQEWKNIYKHSN